MSIWSFLVAVALHVNFVLQDVDARTTRPEVTIRLVDTASTLFEGPIKMRAANGQQFACRVGSSELVAAASEKPICITSNQDQREYWQYQVCIGSNVSQIRVDGGKIQASVLLGKLSDTNASTQVFTGGASGRSAIVNFQCDREAAHPHITRAEEPQSLQYKISIASKVACSIQQTPPLESLPCVERSIGNWHIRVCPRKSVVVTSHIEHANMPKAITFSNLIETSKENNRQIERYNSTEVCKTKPGLLTAKVTYICSLKQRWPMLLGYERNNCDFFLRVSVASVCNVAQEKVECKPITDP